MGDAGSYLVGYLLAMATLTGTFAGGDLPRHAILAPLCVLAVPLYDTATRGAHSAPRRDAARLSATRAIFPTAWSSSGMTQDPGRADDLSGHGDLRLAAPLLHQLSPAAPPSCC